MNFRLTAILFVVVLVLVGGLLVSTLTDDKPAADGLLLAALDGVKPGDVDTVEIAVAGDASMVFVRTGKDKWNAAAPTPARIDAGLMNRIITELLKLKPAISKDLTGDPAQHGLDTPGLTVTLKSEGKSATLLIGDSTIGSDRAETFVAAGTRPTVPLAVKQADLATLFKDGSKDGPSAKLARTLTDYRQKRLLGVEMYNAVESAAGLKIKQGTSEMALTHAGKDWTFASPAGWGRVDLTGDGSGDGLAGLRQVVGVLNLLTASGTADFNENPGPFEKYGLADNDPAMLRIELTGKDGSVDAVLIGKKIENAEPPRHYARIPGERCVVTVTTDRVAGLAALAKDPRPLQDRTLVAAADLTTIDVMTIAAGGSALTAKRLQSAAGPRWALYGGRNDPQYAGPAVAALLTDLTVPRLATEVVIPPNDAAFAQVSGEVKLWRNGIDSTEAKGDALPPEPALKGAPAITLLFGKTEGDSTFVRRTLADGTKTDFKIPATIGAKAARPRTDYLDTKLAGFATTLAVRLTFNRGAEPFDVVRKEPEVEFPSGKWVFESPAALKGQVADEDKVGGGSIAAGAGLLGILGTLSADRVLSEAPTEAELKAWGLDVAAPRLKVTAYLKEGDAKERTYIFGHETPDKAYVYFREPAKPLVYLVPRVAVDAFFTQDLRDRTPYRVPVADVAKVRLRWWKQQKVTELVIEKKDNAWIAAATPPYKADALVMQNLLNHLHAPKPMTLVGAVAKEHGFGAGDADPLEVAFLDAAGKEMLNCTLGNDTDGAAAVFLWNSITKDVITVSAAMYKPFKESPDVFRPKKQ